MLHRVMQCEALRRGKLQPQQQKVTLAYSFSYGQFMQKALN